MARNILKIFSLQKMEEYLHSMNQILSYECKLKR